jgi:hypothetical protein
MNTVAHDRIEPQSNPAASRSVPSLATIAIWSLASLIAVFFALIQTDSSVIGDHWVPRGNDSFYHARRILDAAVGARGFYQFDDRLHVPDGTWIPWPWAYDYLMAKATQIAMWLAPSLEPIVFISYVPVAWIVVNALLFAAVARTIGLRWETLTLAMFCFAISPLTQLLHSVGMIDHHYVELTFVLLNAWLGLRWFAQPAARGRAAALGVTLGAATAFHNGLFILQLFPLLTVFILWVRQSAPPFRALCAFGLALVVTTQLALLPSEPYRNAMFEFGLHSWFHAYVAACTAMAMAFMGWQPATQKTGAAFIGLSAALTVPLAAQIVGGADFLSGTFSVLDRITEVQSPYRMFTQTMGPSETAGFYSWLLLLAPVLLVVYGYRAVRERRPQHVYFAVIVALGLALLLQQMRLHYFGYFGLIAGMLVVVEELGVRRAWHRGLTFIATFAVIALAFQPALRARLFVDYAPSSDPEYASAFTLFLELEKLCATEPGTVLASPDDGNAILFHSNCSVIANNFILTSQDAAHIAEIDRLMRLPPEQIRTERRDIKYLLLRTEDFSTERDGVEYLVAQNPLAKALFIDPSPPHGYEALMTVHRRLENGRPSGVYARLFKVTQ